MLGQASTCITEAEWGRQAVWRWEVGGVNMGRGVGGCGQGQQSILPLLLWESSCSMNVCVCCSQWREMAHLHTFTSKCLYPHWPWHNDQTPWIQVHLPLQESHFTSKTVWLAGNAESNGLWRINKHNIPVSSYCDSGHLGIKPSVLAVLVSCGAS